MARLVRRTWHGNEILARSRRANGRAIVGMAERASLEMTKNTHVVSGDLKRSIHAAKHHSMGEIPASAQAARRGEDEFVLEVGSWLPYACFAAGTEVTLADGRIKTVEDITTEDFVLSASGRTCAVTSVSKSWSDSTLSLERVGRTLPTVVSPEHPFLTRKNGNPAGEPMWTNALNLVKGPQRQTHRFVEPVLKENEYSNDLLIETSDKRGSNGSERKCLKKTYRVPFEPALMRLFGYYLAEGYDRGRFCFHEDEVEFHDDVAALLMKYFGCSVSWCKRRADSKGAAFYLTGGEGLAAREFFSWAGRGAANKCVPSWMLRMPLEHQEQLLLGYWRGDGMVTKNGYSIGTTSRSLAESVRIMWNRLGVASNLCQHPARDVTFFNGHSLTRLPFYSISAGGGNAWKWADRVQEGASVLDCGDCEFARIDGDFASYALSGVEPAPGAWVYNLSTSSETYVADGVAVHNCVENSRGGGHRFADIGWETAQPFFKPVLQRAWREEGL